MANERKQYTQKEKMHYFAQQSKKGAKKANGQPLSDFERGVAFNKSQQIGQQLGRYKWKKAKEAGDEKTIAEMRATRAEIRAQRKREIAEYKARKEAKKRAGKK